MYVSMDDGWMDGWMKVDGWGCRWVFMHGMWWSGFCLLEVGRVWGQEWIYVNF